MTWTASGVLWSSTTGGSPCRMRSTWTSSSASGSGWRGGRRSGGWVGDDVADRAARRPTQRQPHVPAVYVRRPHHEREHPPRAGVDGQRETGGKGGGNPGRLGNGPGRAQSHREALVLLAVAGTTRHAQHAQSPARRLAGRALRGRLLGAPAGDGFWRGQG